MIISQTSQLSWQDFRLDSQWKWQLKLSYYNSACRTINFSPKGNWIGLLEVDPITSSQCMIQSLILQSSCDSKECALSLSHLSRRFFFFDLLLFSSSAVTISSVISVLMFLKLGFLTKRVRLVTRVVTSRTMGLSSSLYTCKQGGDKGEQ